MPQQPEDCFGVAGVEIAGGALGDDEIGVRDDGARDRNALLLATGERARKMVEPFFEADNAQGGLSQCCMRSALLR